MKMGSGATRTVLLLLILVVLIVAGAVLSPLFLRYANIVNLLTQASFTGILSIGMTFVILTAGIDLSVGSIVGFSSILFATLLHGSLFTFMPQQIFTVSAKSLRLTPLFPMPINLLVVLVAGAILGLINGTLSYSLRLHSFVITLGMMFAVRGLGMSYTNGQPLYGVPQYVNFMAYNSLLGVPVPAVLWIVLLLIGAFVLTFTRYGRRTYAVGGNEETARLSGIMPGFYRIAPFVISGVGAALVGVLMTGRMGAGDPTIANGWELDAIGAVVIGGTILEGGRGNLGGTLIGVFIVAVVSDVMDLLSVRAYPQEMVKGAIIIAAVALHTMLGRLGNGTTK